MKLYDVIYDNNNAEGTALVSAEKAGDIESILRSEGRLNSNVYKITQIKEVGCSDYPQGVVSEYYGGNTVTPEPTPTPPKRDFDIDSMSLEDLSKLKTKLNRADRVLYVDKIVELTPKLNVQFHPNADVGYSFMNMGRDVSVYKAFHVYVKTKDGYKDLGIPANYAYVQSAQYRVKISNVSSRPREPFDCIKEDIRPLRYGIFLREKKSRGKKKKGTYHKLQFIDFVDGFDQINICRWTNRRIRIGISSYFNTENLRAVLRRGTSRAMRKDQNDARYKEYHGLFVLGRVKRVRSRERLNYIKNARKYRMVGDPIRYIKARFFIAPGRGDNGDYIAETYINIL